MRAEAVLLMVIFLSGLASAFYVSGEFEVKENNNTEEAGGANAGSSGTISKSPANQPEAQNKNDGAISRNNKTSGNESARQDNNKTQEKPGREIPKANKNNIYYISLLIILIILVILTLIARNKKANSKKKKARKEP